jgi:glycolate oxidase
MQLTTSLDALLDDLGLEAPGLRLLTDEVDREAYRLDETAYLEAGLPGAVALPAETSEVSTLLRLASRHRVAVVPRGAGTGLSGGAAGIEGALTVVLTRMNRILEIDPENLCVITQPGVINAELKAAVAREGLFYPPDPASYETCSIGGNLGTNAGGLCCVKYGQTRDWVLGLEVVLADGTVIRTGGRTVKDAAGYSLTHLFVGSQGTLGVITEATLRLRPLPGPRSTMLAFFSTLSAAGDAVAAITSAGIVPVTLELLDHETILAVDDAHGLGLDRDAAAMLLVESDAPGAAASGELDEAEAAITAARATSVVRAADATEADWLRQARRLALRALELRGTVRMEDVGPAGRDRADRGRARRPLRDLRPRRRRQPAPEPDLRPRRSRRGTAHARRSRRDLPGRARPGRHGDGRARDRRRQAGVAADPTRRRRRRGDARDQGRARPAWHPQPGTRPVNSTLASDRMRTIR